MPRALPFASMVAVAAILIFGSLPSSASAENDPDVTYPTGTLLTVNPLSPPSILGTAVTLVNIKAPNGTIMYQCDAFSSTGSLEKNTGSLVEASLSTVFFKSCTTGLGGFVNVGTNAPWCLRSTTTMAADEFQIRGKACNQTSGPVTVTVESCKFERTTPASGQFSTDVEGQDAILSVPNMELVKEASQPFCISSTTFEFIFTLELDTTSTADPLYIS